MDEPGLLRNLTGKPWIHLRCDAIEDAWNKIGELSDKWNGLKNGERKEKFVDIKEKEL